MNSHIQNLINLIYLEQKKSLQFDFENIRHHEGELEKIIASNIKDENHEIQKRIYAEFLSLGPLDTLLEQESITEILVNQFNEIYYEIKGSLIRSEDHFYSETTYTNALDRLSQKCKTYFNREKPFVEAQHGRMRITIIFSELSRGQHLLSIRLQPKSKWTLTKLNEENWFHSKQIPIIQKIISEKKNFLVVGGTGSGKTSFLQSLLHSLNERERAVIIEDTQELDPIFKTNISLLTRQDPARVVVDVEMDDLLKRALRLRPDRLVIGEIRGPEAKSLLMALATGHDGSFGSMHARSAAEALLRLEMLVQMGAPQWSLHSIRHLISMTVQNIFVISKKNGKRFLEGIYEISSLESTGFTLNQIDEVAH